MRSECKREKSHNQIKSKREVEPEKQEKQEETKYQLLEINHVKYAEIGANVKA